MANHSVWINGADEHVLEEEAAQIGIDPNALLCVWIFEMLQSKRHAQRTRTKKEPKRQPGRPRTRKFDQDVLFIRERYERLKEICTPEEYASLHRESEMAFETAVKNFDEQAIADMLREQPWKRK